MKVVFIGAGNLASRAALAFQQAGVQILQVYSRTEESAHMLGSKLGSVPYTCDLSAIVPDADLYIFSVKDEVLEEVIRKVKPNGALWVHTAGSMPAAVFAGHVERYGVFYPMQTFSKEREVDFSGIPVFVEARTPEDTAVLREYAGKISGRIYEAGSERRKYLHLAAVFACNFTNHMYDLCYRLLEEQDIPFDVMLPLIDETAAKVHLLAPHDAQTGPAVRYDRNVMERQSAMLPDEQMKQIYELLSRSIHNARLKK